LGKASLRSDKRMHGKELGHTRAWEQFEDEELVFR
jgi:hypothetical protein